LARRLAFPPGRAPGKRQRGFELPDELPDEPLLPVAEPLELPGLEVPEGEVPVVPLAPELSELPLVVPPMLPPERVFTSAPASMPLERGRVAPRRPSGAVLVVPARPPLFELQAPTPASMAAAEATVIHLLSFIGVPL
jgi:hypothetical protein